MDESAPTVACIITTYFPDSHADVIGSRLLGHFDYEPSVNLVSMYLEQIAGNDIGRKRAAGANVPIYPTIYQAIEAGGSPVDGIVVIGEHGEYPWTANRQKMYPRRRFHEHVLDAIDELGLTVSVFNDKHFAYDMEDARWIYRQYTDREIPFFGGSSVPLQDRVPAVDPSELRDVEDILVVHGGGVESYGFHGMEVLQSLAEHRAGGETGVKWIEPFEGRGVWDAADRDAWPADLLPAALEHSRSDLLGDPRTSVDVPTLFTVQYEDGTQGSVLNLRAFDDNWLFACRTTAGEVIAGHYETDLGPIHRHFDDLVAAIEELILTRNAPIPPERTLMTTGLIDISMKALRTRERRMTPELGFGYR